jgi:hypothetical protein
MARAVYAHELSDPDFEWLLSNYRERCDRLVQVDGQGMPVTFLNLEGIPIPKPASPYLIPPPAQAVLDDIPSNEDR